MTTRTIILCGIAVISGLVWLNLQMFSVLDQQIDRMAQARQASMVRATIGKVSYQCYADRRVRK